MNKNALYSLLFLFFILLLANCTPTASSAIDSDPTATIVLEQSEPKDACPVTEAEWLLHPEDTAVQGDPTYGHYFTNKDGSMLASAWWVTSDEYTARADDGGIKVGWFRPAGAELSITGERLDGEAPPLEASIPCCYPTQFQATGIKFPTEGCWRVHATAAESELSFVVWIEPYP